jgi:hypothetical protein
MALRQRGRTEYEYDWGTIARKEKRANEIQISSKSFARLLERSFSFFNRTRTRPYSRSLLVSRPRNKKVYCLAAARSSWLFFKAQAKHPYLSHTRRASPAAAGRKNSQLAPAQRVAMKMGRRLFCLGSLLEVRCRIARERAL